jgi:hypothetical protein
MICMDADPRVPGAPKTLNALDLTGEHAPPPAPGHVRISPFGEAGVDRYIVMDRTADFTREPERLIVLAEILGLAPARSAAIASAEPPG